MSGPSVALAVLSKDLLLDLRSRDRLGHMAIFAALIIVLIGLVLPSSDPAVRYWIPVLLWMMFLFTALLGLARSFAIETEEGGLVLLARVPCDRGWVFLGKAAANWITLVGVQLWTAFLAAIFLRVEWGDAAAVSLGVAALGAFGLAAVGTLMAAVSASARFREFLLPLLLFPLMLPVLIPCSLMTADALAGRDFPATWWGALALYDWAFALIAYFVFDYVLED